MSTTSMGSTARPGSTWLLVSMVIAMVAEALADHVGWDASGQGGGRIAVADVVQPDLGQAGRMGVLLEPSGEALRVDGAAIRPGEYQARLLPAWANRPAAARAAGCGARPPRYGAAWPAHRSARREIVVRAGVPPTCHKQRSRAVCSGHSRSLREGRDAGHMPLTWTT
jgi:hypothetical protein